MSLYRQVSEKLFPRVHKLLEKELANCATVLDLGCGRRSPLRRVSKKIYSEGVDLYAPYLKTSQERKIHNKYHLMDLREIDFPPRSFDCVMALDVLEHLSREEAYRLVEKMERIAKEKVIIFVPNGPLPQVPVNGNPWQAHLSAWTVKEMKELGYRIKGVNGLKFLRKEEAALKYRPAFFWEFVSDLTQVWTYPRANSAFQLFCVKELAETNQGTGKGEQTEYPARASRFYQGSEDYREILAQHDREYFEGYLGLIKLYLEKGNRVLELGCGTGVSTNLLQALGYRATGLEISFKFIEQSASKAGPGAGLVVGDACSLPFKEKIFDGVVSCDFIEHVPDARAALAEMTRVVTKAGTIIIKCPNLYSPFRPLLYTFRLLLGRGPTPVWAESAFQGFKNIAFNIGEIGMRKFSKEVKFHYRAPCLEGRMGVYGGDVDASYLSNPVDLRRYLESARFVVINKRRGCPGEGWMRRLIRKLLPDFVSPTVIVARRVVGQ